MDLKDREKLVADLERDGRNPRVQQAGDNVDMISFDLARQGERTDGGPPIPTEGEAGAAWLLDFAKDSASALFVQQGTLIAHAIFVGRRDPAARKRLEPASPIICPIDNDMFDGPSSRDRLARWLRKMARLSQAIGYAFLTEAWVLPATPGRMLPRGSWETVPDRAEAIKVVVEHEAWGDEVRGAHAYISRDAAGKPSLGPWVENRSQRGTRMAGVLPTAAEREDFERDYQGIYRFKMKGWTKEQMVESLQRQRDRAQAEGDHDQALGIELLMERVAEDPNL